MTNACLLFYASQETQAQRSAARKGVLEKGIIGMEVGKRKTITIPPEDGFGPRREELVVDVDRSELPKNMEPAIGQRVRMPQDDGQNIDLVITDVAEDTITLDANHPLAGRMLLFDLELVAIA